MNVRRLLLSSGLVVALAACGSASVFDLTVGDCFDDPPESGEISSVTAVDCAEPHDNEVYALFDYDGSGEYPGEGTLSTAADEGCRDRFDAYVGTPYLESEVYYTHLIPTEESWGDGDREIVCVLYIPDEKIEGSLEGSGR
ncbi:MAG TPA: septum formation family protein [Candidatus Limnocylindria bacterium]|nr:septum formation family protein [Candidatus Limnocylindria bacterium]